MSNVFEDSKNIGFLLSLDSIDLVKQAGIVYKELYQDRDEPFNPLSFIEIIKTLEVAKNLPVQKEVFGATKLETESHVDHSRNTVYSDKWIVMQNRLLNAISNLDLNERRLIMFLSPIVRKSVDRNPTERVFTVRVQDFTKEYGIVSKQYYTELAKIADTILEKAFFFWHDDENRKAKKGISWVSECDYIENEGLLKIKLDDTVIEMLTVFNTHNPFTKYELQAIVNLGSYGIVLYSLISSNYNRKNKKFSCTIEFLREHFNCVHTYAAFSDFRKYVLNRAIKDIESHTTLKITYKTKKDGRRISAIEFSFYDTKPIENKTQIKQEDKKTLNMTDKQRKYFASKLSKLSECSELPGSQESYEALAHWIEKDLQKDDRADFYAPLLKQVGYTM